MERKSYTAGRSGSGRCMSSCSAKDGAGSETSPQCEQQTRRMLRIAQACARMAARLSSSREALEIADEAKRQLECEIMLARERARARASAEKETVGP